MFQCRHPYEACEYRNVFTANQVKSNDKYTMRNTGIHTLVFSCIWQKHTDKAMSQSPLAVTFIYVERIEKEYIGVDVKHMR